MAAVKKNFFKNFAVNNKLKSAALYNRNHKQILLIKKPSGNGGIFILSRWQKTFCLYKKNRNAACGRYTVLQ